jgi:DNA-binding NtrC family response regulator
LAQHFLKKIAKEEGKAIVEITPEALEMLMDYQWPGNVRELENTLRTATLFHQKGKVTAKSLHFKKQLTGETEETPVKAKAAPRASASVAAEPQPAGMAGGGPAPVLTEEKRLLLKALFDSGYHKGHAAETLGISRRYLYTQLLRHQVPVNRIEMKAYIAEKLKM